MSETLSGSSKFRSGASKSTCTSCSRTVHMIPVDGSLVAVDPEIIRVIRVGRHGGALAVSESVPARRLHAELCDTYQRDGRRDALRKELAAYNKLKGVTEFKAYRKRGRGL